MVTQFGRELGQIVHGAQVGVYLAIVADGVATVVIPFGDLEQRHQVQVGDAHFGEIGDPFPKSVQVAGKQVDVAHRTDHSMRLKPIRVRLPQRIQGLQLRRAGQPHFGGRRQNAFQMIEEIIVIAVQRR